jgi:hypothetical protein
VDGAPELPEGHAAMRVRAHRSGGLGCPCLPSFVIQGSCLIVIHRKYDCSRIEP